MKHQIFKFSNFLIITLLLASCKHFNGYEISGTVKNGDGVKVYLEDISADAILIIDTVTIKSTAFHLKNYSPEGIYRLRFGEDETKSIFLFIQKRDKIDIQADLNQLENYNVHGSKGSTSIQQFSSASKKRFKELDIALQQLKAATPKSKDSLQTNFMSEQNEYVKFIKGFIEKEPINDVACFGLNFLGPIMKDEIPYLVDVVDKLHTENPDSRYINLWYKETKQYRDAIMAATEGGVALNTQAPNIVLQNPNGDTIQLKNLEGNYVLVDFWASWCQPCREENPNVVALYNKYHAQGFEVFSVSLDANADKWKQAIAKDGLIWKNHGCDFSGWNSAPAQTYNVKSIPCTFLLDKKGKVIAKSLRGDDLADKLEELFSEKIN